MPEVGLKKRARLCLCNENLAARDIHSRGQCDPGKVYDAVGSWVVRFAMVSIPSCDKLTCRTENCLGSASATHSLMRSTAQSTFWTRQPTSYLGPD